MRGAEMQKCAKNCDSAYQNRDSVYENRGGNGAKVTGIASVKHTSPQRPLLKRSPHRAW
jgi:hypothetical protein